MRQAMSGKCQGGFTLVEVLVALVILAFGLLGLAGLQSVGLKNIQASQWRSQATMLGYDVIDRMRSNCQAALGGDYDITLAASAPSGSAMAAADLQRWRTSLSTALVSGTGSVSVNAGTRIATVTIQWDESRASAGSATHQVQISGILPSLATCQST